MREIKFRVWDIYEERFLDDTDILFMHLDGKLKFQEEEYEIKREVVIMQYTGLKDKNGVEIYKGDILTANHYPFQNYYGVIEWIDECASFYMTKRLSNSAKRGISDGVSEPIEDLTSFEIIGNLYEHKHLLEGKQR